MIGWVRSRLARLVTLVTGIVVGIVVIGILLVVFDANRGNGIVDFVLDVGEFLVEPFDNVFKPDGKKARVGANWGVAAAIYACVGATIAGLIRR